VASSIQTAGPHDASRTSPLRRKYEIDDFLKRPLSTLILHRDGYSHWGGVIHPTQIQTTHFSFVMAWIRKRGWICSEEQDVALHLHWVC
jgi:hypothetical protein